MFWSAVVIMGSLVVIKFRKALFPSLYRETLSDTAVKLARKNAKLGN